jgi:dephospho-CoA kinase
VFNVGLTGNVASGKSTVARQFERAGATLLDADRMVRDVQRPDSPVLSAIADRFGATMLRPDGSLDRDRLRGRILADPAARSDLERIVHPAVQERRTQLLAAARARGDLVVVHDIPLLFEALDPADFDLVVLVHSSAGVRRGRLIRLRGMAPQEADRLIASQIPSEAKRDRADVVIDNDADRHALDRTAAETWARIRKAGAAHATVPGGALLVVVAHPDDATVLLRGTLGRHADAGTRIRVVCATGQCGAAVPAGVAVTELARRPGTLDPEDQGAVAALTALIEGGPPNAVITFGPGGIGAERDHHAVHRWTTAALRLTGSACPLYHPVPPDPRFAGDRSGVSAALDVRPWRGEVTVGLAACGVRYEPEAVPAPWHGREWYAGEVRQARCRSDLLAPETAG